MLNAQWVSNVIVLGPNDSIILVIEMDHAKPLWKIPGGRQEPYENSPTQTAIRELEEETGILSRESDLVYIKKYLLGIMIVTCIC